VSLQRSTSRPALVKRSTSKSTASYQGYCSSPYSHDPQFLRFEIYFLPLPSPKSVLFAKYIMIQEQHQQQHRAVAIRGIPPSAMSKSNTFLCSRNPHILKILEINDTTHITPTGHPLGRFNLICRAESFPSLAKELHQHLSSTFSDFLLTVSEPFPHNPDEIQVVSKFPGQIIQRNQQQDSIAHP
jgi:hypothetical protein